MKLIREALSLSAKFDLVLLSEDMVAIIELKKSGTRIYSFWWVAGLTSEQRLAVAYQSQFALKASDTRSAEERVKDAAIAIFALARESLDAGGVTPIPLMGSLEQPKALASTFLYAFESQGLFRSQMMELNVSTGLQYQFCQMLKVSKPVEFLAEYLGVPVTTVRQRITWARNKGVLPKRRDLNGEANA
jgi:hypothetical protein